MTIALFIVTRPSHILLAASMGMLMLAHLGILLSLRAFGMSWAIAGPIVLLVACLASRLVFRHWQRSQPGWQLSIAATGEMVLHGRQPQGGHMAGLSVHLSHKTRIWPYFLSVFLLDEAGMEYKLLILPDSLDAVAFRALRVSLIWISQHPV